MLDQNYLNDFIKTLISDEEWLKKCLLKPRLLTQGAGAHGADHASIDVDIRTTPIIFSFKFSNDENKCCINLRVRLHAADLDRQRFGANFDECIKKFYGQQFTEIGVRIAGGGNEVYFKPFGRSVGARTTDVYFDVGDPLVLTNQAEVFSCHEMWQKGRIGLRDAVILVLNRLGFGPEQQDQGAAPVVPPLVAPAAAPVGGEQLISIGTTRYPSPEIPYQPAPVRETQSRPLVNQIMHFMHDHCTGSGVAKAQNQKKFITELRELLKLTTLQHRSEGDLWRLMWDKPIYANENNNRATKVIQRCRREKLFDDLTEISEDVASLQGLRDPVEKLERIRRLSKEFKTIYDLYKAALQALQNPVNQRLAQNSQAGDFDSVRQMIGVLPQRGRVNSIYRAVDDIRGFGGITALHMLVDFGFPVCKPDLWIVRTVIAFLNIHNSSRPDLVEFIRQKHPEFKLAELSQDLLNQRPQYSLRVLDYIVKHELDFTDPFFKANGIDLEIRFRGHRLADLIVAKFGMTAEERFGLLSSPMDRLNADSILAKRYPELAHLADELRRWRR